MTYCMVHNTVDETRPLERLKRQDDSLQQPLAESANGEAESEAESEAASNNNKKETSQVSLGKILAILFMACCVVYCVGIGYKIYKICKGTYVEEPPVFLKYK
jgi:hypothetical protein